MNKVLKDSELTFSRSEPLGNAQFVSVVVPTLNEEAYIEGLLKQLSSQAPDKVVEIIVADGGSDDATRELVEAAAERDARIKLLDNPDRIQSAGVNLAAQNADPRSNILIRIDAHSHYSDDYIPKLLTHLSEQDADSVVVRLKSKGQTCFQTAVAAASNSKLGTGGSLHRVGAESRYVDHGHHAAFRLSAFRDAGGYDETFIANEDAEFDMRLVNQGGQIWFAGDIEVEYFPRRTPLKLMKQYFSYGKGRCRTFLKHGARPAPRQLAPVALVIGLAMCFLAAFWAPLAALPPLLYGAGILAGAVFLTVQTRKVCALLSVVTLPIMHVSWGSGFLWQLRTRFF
ncbi:MAG: glycosyltransferase family 2 protein [Pseudomonadota bacterium]